jgi:hypothetical protein
MNKPMPNEQRVRLPNLYQLLSLQPLEDDRGKIEQALRQVYAEFKASESSNPKRAAKAARIVELGKQHLLSADRKQTYDRHWIKAFRSEPAVAPAFAWDYSQLSRHLPSGDPQQPFDLPQFLKSAASAPQADHAAEYAQLTQLLEQSLAATEQSVAKETQDQSPREAATASVVAKPVQPSSSKRLKGPRTRVSPPLAKQIRRKRERSLLFTSAGALACLAALLGIALYFMNSGDSPNQSLANNGNSLANQNRSQPASETTKFRGSGLPKVQGFSGNGAATGSMPLTSANPANAPEPSPPPTEPVSEPVSEPVPQMSPEDDPSITTNSAGGTADAAEAMPPDSPSMQAPPAANNSTSVEALTAEEKAAWFSTLTDARELIGKQEYDSAAAKLEDAKTLVKSEVQREQLERLANIHRLAQEFQKTLLAAIASLSAGETFTVGSSTQASFVEGSPSRVVVRIRGQNQSFSLTEMPVGLAFGLVALKTDITHPTSLAQQSAFTLVHPASAGNDLAIARSKTMMSEAISAGAAAADMLDVFSDDYRL